MFLFHAVTRDTNVTTYFKIFMKWFSAVSVVHFFPIGFIIIIFFHYLASCFLLLCSVNLKCGLGPTRGKPATNFTTELTIADTQKTHRTPTPRARKLMMVYFTPPTPRQVSWLRATHLASAVSNFGTTLSQRIIRPPVDETLNVFCICLWCREEHIRRDDRDKW